MSWKLMLAPAAGALVVVGQVTASAAHEPRRVEGAESARPETTPITLRKDKDRLSASMTEASGTEASRIEKGTVSRTVTAGFRPSPSTATASTPPPLDRIAVPAAEAPSGAAGAQAQARVKKNSNMLPSRLVFAVGGIALVAAAIAATSDSSDSD